MKKLDQEGYEIMKQLVSDVQGAPYPNVIENELYRIWYEHAQLVAIQCLEYIDVNFPKDRESEAEKLPKF
ncbi:MAG TPA: hypothetical protein PK542_00830 [Treponemataceae bacterium]|nr:hypothetical protein [Treponemataceae bacterium]HPS43010.1 hypothetical protein [Treponemataceae bacterium]